MVFKYILSITEGMGFGSVEGAVWADVWLKGQNYCSPVNKVNRGLYATLLSISQ